MRQAQQLVRRQREDAEHLAGEHLRMPADPHVPPSELVVERPVASLHHRMLPVPPRVRPHLSLLRGVLTPGPSKRQYCPY